MVNSEGLKLLTNREEDVVRLLSEGMQNREIASELKLSEHTVKNYIFHIFDKLGVSSRVELVMYAVSSSKGIQTVSVPKNSQEDGQAGDSGVVGKPSADANLKEVAKASQLQNKKPKR
jgi:DNA-binding CsgD family transcriptional regulator